MVGRCRQKKLYHNWCVEVAHLAFSALMPKTHLCSINLVLSRDCCDLTRHVCKDVPFFTSSFPSERFSTHAMEITSIAKHEQYKDFCSAMCAGCRGIRFSKLEHLLLILRDPLHCRSKSNPQKAEVANNFDKNFLGNFRTVVRAYIYIFPWIELLPPR